MQAYQALTANRTFLLANDVQQTQGHVRSAQKENFDFPAYDLPTGTVELGDAILDHRVASIRTFALCRFVPAFMRICSALTRTRKFLAAAFWTRPRLEDAITLQYQGRSWCDSTERELNNDIASWRATRF